MAEITNVHMSENSPEHVAYRLLQEVMQAEKRTPMAHVVERRESNVMLADRKYLLDTYAECLAAARGHREI